MIYTINLQITGGSSSIRYTGQTAMRVAGAAAREMLIEASANHWGVAKEELVTKLGHVHHNSTGRSLRYGEIAQDAALLEPRESPLLKSRSQFNIMGKALSRGDIPSKVNGSAIFGIDAYSENMLFAAIKLAPVFGTKLVSADSSKALAQIGVKQVIELEDSIAVVADNYWRAKTLWQWSMPHSQLPKVTKSLVRISKLASIENFLRATETRTRKLVIQILRSETHRML